MKEDPLIDIEGSEGEARVHITKLHLIYSKIPLSKNIKLFSAVAFLISVLVGTTCLSAAAHRIEEGTVGIYYRNGALLNSVTHPGVHLMAPFICDVIPITTRIETETLDPIMCVTRDGIQTLFENVQVVSSVHASKIIPVIKLFGVKFKKPLLFDRIGEKLQKFCSNHTIDEVYNSKFNDIEGILESKVKKSLEKHEGAIEIHGLVVIKPIIPIDIANNYKLVKVQWSEQLVATQQQKTEKIKKETEAMKAVMDARRDKDVFEITLEQATLQKQGEKNLTKINNDILKLAEENRADIEHYRAVKEAEANGKLFTDKYVKLSLAKSLSQNAKLIFTGENSPIGDILKNEEGKWNN